MLWVESDYFGVGKIKCGISIVDVERLVVWLGEMIDRC